MSSAAPVLPTPLRVLAWRAPDAAVSSLDRALAPWNVDERMHVEELRQASEIALRQALAQPWHVAVLADVRGKAQPAARLAQLQMQASDGGLREVSAQHLGALLAGCASLRLVVLLDGDPGLGPLIASILVRTGVPAAIATTERDGGGLAAFAGELRAALLEGQPLAAVFGNRLGIQVAVREPGAALWSPAPPTAAGPATASAPAPAAPSAEDLARTALERKRRAGAFDVFLCHNGADKPAVKRIAERLKARGVLPWLDEWELPPGQPWQPLLEKQIASIRSAAVFVGGAGIGPWQQAELYGFLSEFRDRGCPVIPVLLPDAPERPALPIFLKAMTWVDFRVRDPDPLERLIWGVLGERVGEG